MAIWIFGVIAGVYYKPYKNLPVEYFEQGGVRPVDRNIGAWPKEGACFQILVHCCQPDLGANIQTNDLMVFTPLEVV